MTEVDENTVASRIFPSTESFRTGHAAYPFDKDGLYNTLLESTETHCIELAPRPWLPGGR
jgi:hypothetical protein